jgi:hypothetical protein
MFRRLMFTPGMFLQTPTRYVERSEPKKRKGQHRVTQYVPVREPGARSLSLSLIRPLLWCYFPCRWLQQNEVPRGQ